MRSTFEISSAELEGRKWTRPLNTIVLPVPSTLCLNETCFLSAIFQTGRKTDVLWSVVFTKVDNISRHPSQIYEAILEGLVLFFIMYSFTKKDYLRKPGLISSLFLIFYSLFRFFVEFFRVPDEQIGFIFLNLTMGQIISLIFLSSGFYLLSTKKNEN